MHVGTAAGASGTFGRGLAAGLRERAVLEPLGWLLGARAQWGCGILGGVGGTVGWLQGAVEVSSMSR